MGLFHDLLGGIKINGGVFGHSFMLRSARRSAAKHMWPFLDKLGAARIQTLIDRGESLHQHLTFDKLPSEWLEFANSAPKYRFLLDILDLEDMAHLLPDWMEEIVTRDEKGWEWFTAEMNWLIQLFEPREENSGTRRNTQKSVGRNRSRAPAGEDQSPGPGGRRYRPGAKAADPQ